MTVQVVRASLRSTDEVELELQLVRMEAGTFSSFRPRAADFPVDFLEALVEWATEGIVERVDRD